MAVLTLRKLDSAPLYTSGQDVKISRRAVKATVVATSLCAGQDWLLKGLFSAASLGLPQFEIPPRGPTFIEGMETQHSL